MMMSSFRRAVVAMVLSMAVVACASSQTGSAPSGQSGDSASVAAARDDRTAKDGGMPPVGSTAPGAGMASEGAMSPSDTMNEEGEMVPTDAMNKDDAMAPADAMSKDGAMAASGGASGHDAMAPQDAAPTPAAMSGDETTVNDGAMSAPGAMPTVESMRKDGDPSDSSMRNDDSMMRKDDSAMSKPGVMSRPEDRCVPYTAEAVAAASRNGRAVLFFRADWCPTCRAADADFRANPSRIPVDVTLLAVNYDTEGELKRKHRITYQHTFVQVDGKGNEVGRWSGGGARELLANVK